MANITFSPSGDMGSYGRSEPAEVIARASRARRAEWLESETFGKKFVESTKELQQIFDECKRDNWDGYESLPVSQAAFDAAYKFIEALLPFNLPAPSVGAEPDGHITLEWYVSPRRTLSLSLSPEGEIHYAALIGEYKPYDSIRFYGEIPEVIRKLIAQVYVE